MNIDLVIAQLREYAPFFGGNVAGAASYAQAHDQVWLPQPAAYVIPLDLDPQPNATMTGVVQDVTERIGIIVDLSNACDPTDRRGQAAATLAVDDAWRACMKALLGWRPEPAKQKKGFLVAGGGLLGDGVNRAWLRWQFDFSIVTTLTAEADGWQPPSDPLLSIKGTVDEKNGQVLAGFIADNLQS